MPASDRPGLGMPLAVCTALLVLLVGGSAAFGGSGGGGDSGSSGAAAEPARKVAPIPVIARRVEAIRGLKFTTVPRPLTVNAATAKREGLADLDRSYPPERRRADEELYKLLGLLRPGDDFREIAASVFEGQVSGYYDPRNGRLRVVKSGGAENAVMEETTLAHELNHALEDQVFELDLDDLGASGDEALAYTAMVEGTATALMDEYQRRWFKPSEALGSAAAAAFAAPSTADLPPFVMNQLLFPYLGGQRFINELYRTGGDTWRLVDVAQRSRPPASTEQVMHPRAYLRVEQPVKVRLGGVGRVLGGGWERVLDQTFGEWQTREWLRRGTPALASDAAEGWGGDRVQLWQRGAADGCTAPCVRRDALVMRWVWDSADEADEFLTAMYDALEKGLDAQLGEALEWRVRGGAAAAAADGRQVTLAFAPSLALARKISQR